MSPYVRAWLSAFVFTQAVEVPIYVAAQRRARRADDGALGRSPASPGAAPDVDRGRFRSLTAQIIIAFGASLITHPMVWFVLLTRLHYDAYWVMIARAEVFAVVVEAFYFYSLHIFDLRRAMLWSLAANASSVGLGEISRALFAWP